MDTQPQNEREPVQPEPEQAASQQTAPPKTNRVLVFLAGLALGLAAQIVVLPVALFLGIAAADRISPLISRPAPVSSGTDFVILVIVSIVALLIEVVLVGFSFLLARRIQQIALFQGCLIGAVIAWLLYSGCFSLLATG